MAISGKKNVELEKVRSRCLAANQDLKHEDIYIVPMEFADLASHEKRFKKVIDHFKRLDILINVGSHHTTRSTKWTMTFDRELFEANVFATVNLSRLVANHWIDNHQAGHICVTRCYSDSPTATEAAIANGLHGYFDNCRDELSQLNIAITIAQLAGIGDDVETMELKFKSDKLKCK